MGECGCGASNVDFTLRVGGRIITIGAYPGCQYCDTPIGVDIDCLSLKEAEFHGLPFDEATRFDASNWEAVKVPMVGPDELLAAYDALIEVSPIGDFPDPREWLAEHARQLLQDALRLRKWKGGQC